jgi:hypothetical protein
MDKSDIVVKITYRKRRVDLTMTGRRDVPKFAGILRMSSLRRDILRSVLVAPY